MDPWSYHRPFALGDARNLVQPLVSNIVKQARRLVCSVTMKHPNSEDPQKPQLFLVLHEEKADADAIRRPWYSLAMHVRLLILNPKYLRVLGLPPDAYRRSRQATEPLRRQ
jgi:hypothetical protein